MADTKIGDLTRATKLDDSSLLVAEQLNEAVAVSGALLKSYAQEATRGFAESASADAATAAGAKTAAQSALAGVQAALNNLPAGDTLIVNDLTTGGTTAALSAEMGKVLGCRPNPNLLHNWYFANPVNQRGAASYSSAGYTIDRWKIANDRLKVTPEAGGLKLERIATGAWTAIRQYFYQLEAGHYTVSALVSNLSNAEASLSVYKVASASSATFNSSNRIGSDSRTDAGMLTCSFDYTPDSALPYVAVTIGVPSATGVGGSFKVVAAKMERGDTQTLAHWDGSEWVLNEIPDYNEELLKCCLSKADSGDGYSNKTILHTGNKPSGSYTGNGSTMEVSIGGIGNALLLTNSVNGRSMIVMYAGAIGISGGNVVGYSWSAAQYVNGTLKLNSAEFDLNASGVTYKYEVL